MSFCVSRREALAAGVPFVSSLKAQIGGLRSGLSGRVIVPADADYDSARKLASFNPTTDKHPKLIVRCATAEDVGRAVVFAREQGLGVAVRSGGHDLQR